MGYLPEKPMKYLAKSPFLRSAVVTGIISTAYLKGLAKVELYKYIRPAKTKKPEYRSGTALPRYKVEVAERPERYEEALVPARTLGSVVASQFKSMRLLAHSKLTLSLIYTEFGFNVEDLHCQSQDVIDHLLNGAFPMELTPDPKNPKILQCQIRFSDYGAGERCKLPDVTGRFRRTATGLAFHEIIIEDRHLGRHVYRPDSPPDHWKMAQTLFVGTFSYYGEVYNHVFLGHIELEQYAIALIRNLTVKNPLFKLLNPHMAGLGAVNGVADKTLIGRNGIFTGRDLLSNKAVEKFMFLEMQKIDWKTWEPAKPLGAFHSYAHISRLFWKVVTEFLDEYFMTHQAEMLEYRAEIEGFSKDLVQHSVPKNSHGHQKALSSLIDDDPREIIKNLKTLCRYLIYKTTFAHSWVHLVRTDTPAAYRQRFFKDPKEYFAFQESYEVLVSLISQLALEYSSLHTTKTYMDPHYPSILKGFDPYGVSDIFRAKLEKYRDDFRQLKFNVDFVMTGIH